VAGSDLFALEQDGLCQIQKWVEGQKLFNNASFYIYPRPVEGELTYPPNHILVHDFEPLHISSSEIRKRESLTKD
jgi:nicotinic acid mononucleotide adenylyltransferase